MGILAQTTSQVKLRLREIQGLRTFHELVDFIPLGVLGRIAAVLLIIWTLVPVLILLLGMLMAKADQFDLMLAQAQKSLVWLTFLTQIGILGWLMSVVALAKSLYAAKAAAVPWGAYIRQHATQVFLGLMLAWSLVSAILAGDHRIAFLGTGYRQEGFLTYLLYGGIFSCACLIRDSKLADRILTWFTTAATGLSLLSILDIPALNRFFIIESKTSVFFNANHFAYYLLLALMGSLLLILKYGDKSPRGLLHYLSLATTAAALARNESFGPFLAALFGFILLFVLTRKSGRQIVFRVTLSFVLFGLATLAMNLIHQTVLMDFMRLLLDSRSIIKGSDDALQAGSSRWLLWTNGIRFIGERPLFGYGPDNLGAQYLALGIDIDRPHNEWIQFAASLGIPALLFYLAALGSRVKALARPKILHSLTGIGLAGILAAYLFSSLLGNTMYYTTPYFLIMLGLSVGLTSVVPGTPEAERSL